ncbi:hypothetical protein MASR2M52_16490 [Pedobacter sp.]
MVVGVAYVKQNKTGCSLFTTAEGYKYRIENSANIKMIDLRNEVEKELKSRHVKPEVMLKTATNKNTAVIISYYNPISGYPNCTKHSYAVGFGNSYSEARENSIKEMKLYYKGTDWKQIAVIE